MKRHLNLIIATILACGLLAVTAAAQTSAPQKMRANIPFAFNVGEKTLPPGIYTFTVINPSSDRRALQIRSLDGRFSAITQTSLRHGKHSDDAKLVFRRYDDQYFFAQIEMAGEAETLVAARSRAERSTRRTLKRPADNSVIAAF
jgi:hypothetical protein